MEATTLTSTGASGLRGPTPLLRLQSDERLVLLTRKGNQAAYEALVARYQSRLLAFCRHMLSSKEDAEDVLQEVFAASYSALMADERDINVRPWFYRIARNRSLNHLRRKSAVGVDSMDIHQADHGTTTADRVHQREEFRLLMGDVHELAETQRTALLLREIDNLSYDQIAEAMDTTVSSVKSLLVRARVGLAEAAEARELSCEEVRAELGEVAEGLCKLSAPVRRHCRSCDRCGVFRDHLKQTNKTLALMLPVAPFLLIKKLVLAHLGTTASAGTASAGVAAGAGTAGSAGAGGILSASVAAIASKTAAGLAAAAIVTAGAVEVDHSSNTRHHSSTAVAQVIAPPAAAAPVAVASTPQPAAVVAKHVARHAAAATDTDAAAKASAAAAADAKQAADDAKKTQAPAVPTTAATTTPVAPPAPAVTAPAETVSAAPQTGGDTTVLPSAAITDHTGGGSDPAAQVPPVATAPTVPTETPTTPDQPVTGDGGTPTVTTPPPPPVTTTPAAPPSDPPQATTPSQGTTTTPQADVPATPDAPSVPAP